MGESLLGVEMGAEPDQDGGANANPFPDAPDATLPHDDRLFHPIRSDRSSS